MLIQLSIRNIILIHQLDITLQAGMCVLTGETGAGKSILLDALGFAIGDRASAKLLRSGEQLGSVTAHFDISHRHDIADLLHAQGLACEGQEVILRRTIDAQGKSKAYVNDQPVTAIWLKGLGEQLIEVHGQHDQRGLLDSKTNREALDNFGQLTACLKDTAEAYQTYRRAKREQEELIALHEKAQQEQDYLRYIYQELQTLDVTADEATLAQQRQRLMHQEKINHALDHAYDLLAGNQPLERTMVAAQSELHKFIEIEPAFKTIIDTLERAVIEINEAQESLERFMHKRPAGEESLEKIEQTLFALRGASRKYHVPIEGLEAFRDETLRKLNQLDHYDITRTEIDAALAAAREHYGHCAKILSQRRQSAAVQLEKKIMSELQALKMESTRFQVQIDTLPEANWTEAGTDKVTFMASTNPGSPLALLSKIASGGELSRFMLAMKVALSDVKSIPTLIFDEIDTGIGGATADAVGKRLKMLAGRLQVLVVTHQPQVASKGDLHIKITKHQQRDTTFTNLEILTQDKRLEEIARMLAGQQITPEARAAAGKLLMHVA